MVPAGVYEFAKAISTITEQFDNFIGALEMVRKFGDTVSVGFALDLDADHDNIMEGEEVLGAGFIHPLLFVSTATATSHLHFHLFCVPVQLTCAWLAHPKQLT